jgi:Zn-finger nucleic acid-binding protein
MNCPNENTEMHQVEVHSHYGQPILLEQCDKCGGIWFDESELYRVKLGEAEKIEGFNSELLQTSSEIKNSKLLCPRDRAELFQFKDKNFPQGIILVRCPVCNGFWLNKGEFAKYQKARRELMRPKEQSAEDKKLEENINQLLELHRSGKSNDTLKKLTQFLNTPIDENTLRPVESEDTSPAAEKTVNIIMDVLTTLLNFFVFR